MVVSKAVVSKAARLANPCSQNHDSNYLRFDGQIPIASAALGACWIPSRLVASHFSVMTEHTSQVLIGGPASDEHRC